jgi:hypothetical protein
MARRQQTTTTTSPMAAKQSTSPRLNGLRLQPEHMVRQTSFQQTVAGMESVPRRRSFRPRASLTRAPAGTTRRTTSQDRSFRKRVCWRAPRARSLVITCA